MEETTSLLKAKFIYNITNREEDMAFRAFQKKFTLMPNMIKTILLAVICGLFIQQVISNPDYTLGWALAGVSFALIVFTWQNQRKIRTNLLEALKELEDDKYEFELYENYFSIKTILPEDEITEIEENSDEQEEMPKEIPPRLIYFGKEDIEVLENRELFIIFLKKQTIYTIPKRCINAMEITELRKIFSEKLEEDFVIKE